ncbi:hypothetical protein G7066_13800 [Leucobacter coleopterorum]|uniref:Uncharacterized protein n=1 Tax=Leucobacter coleopterorum TaxID=2714933 RepID=A0ABX6JYR7_9MICO|nr:hypothetical protein [Leucobacter coleopterorum]QIM19382.1 hypothetical protein G7066_13800 [Leucobacter coleopterorum]
MLDVLAGRLSATRDAAVGAIRSKPKLSGLLDVVLALQPIWWVVRAWLTFKILGTFVPGPYSVDFYDIFPDGPLDWVALITITLVSVQWGRGKWMPWRWLPQLRSIGSAVLFVIALVIAPP